MTRALRALAVQSSDAETSVLARELDHAGYDVVCERVDDEATFTAALDRPWDVVLSEWRLDGFGAPDAIAVLKRLERDVPVVVVSSVVGDEVAADAFAFGARDLVELGHPARLGAVVERELRDAARRAVHRRLEDRLEASERLALVGTVAAGLAHEVNNPLGALVANLDRIEHHLSGLDGASGRPIREAVHDARLATDRIRAVVSDAGRLARPEAELRAVDPVRIVEAALRIASTQIRRRAHVVRAYRDTPAVVAAETPLGQVLLNLVINAVQALPEGEAERNVIRVATRRSGPEVVIEVADNGPGIAPAVLPRLFTPFVTTKPGGTGLGLAISQRIVARTGGRITAASDGGWTTFTVTLPAAERAAAAAGCPCR